MECKEYKFDNNVTVRIHGAAPNRETLERACIRLVITTEKNLKRKGREK